MKSEFFVIFPVGKRSSCLVISFSIDYSYVLFGWGEQTGIESMKLKEIELEGRFEKKKRYIKLL